MPVPVLPREYVFEAIRSGASGFLVEHAEPEELLCAVGAVVEGEVRLAASAYESGLVRPGWIG